METTQNDMFYFHSIRFSTTILIYRVAVTYLSGKSLLHVPNLLTFNGRKAFFRCRL